MNDPRATRAVDVRSAPGVAPEAAWVGLVGTLALVRGFAGADAWWLAAAFLVAGTAHVAAAIGLLRALEWARLLAAGIAVVGAAFAIVALVTREPGEEVLGHASILGFEVLLAAALLLPSTRDQLARRRAWLESSGSR